jgi:hypothetical protein
VIQHLRQKLRAGKYFSDFAAGAKCLAPPIHYWIERYPLWKSGEGLRMRVTHQNQLLDKQLHAEIERILRLLERTRRTRQQARLLVALETGVSGRRTAASSGGIRRPTRYRPSLRTRRTGE